MTMKKLLMCAVTMLLVLCLIAGPASAARAVLPPNRAAPTSRLDRKRMQLFFIVIPSNHFLCVWFLLIAG